MDAFLMKCYGRARKWLFFFEFLEWLGKMFFRKCLSCPPGDAKVHKNYIWGLHEAILVVGAILYGHSFLIPGAHSGFLVVSGRTYFAIFLRILHHVRIHFTLPVRFLQILWKKGFQKSLKSQTYTYGILLNIGNEFFLVFGGPFLVTFPCPPPLPHTPALVTPPRFSMLPQNPWSAQAVASVARAYLCTNVCVRQSVSDNLCVCVTMHVYLCMNADPFKIPHSIIHSNAPLHKQSRCCSLSCGHWYLA